MTLDNLPMTPDDLIVRMYASICFERGGRPDWLGFTDLFAPGARLVRVTDEGVFEFDVNSYRTTFEKMISSGEMSSFWEGELWRETFQFSDFAHILSAYETRTARDGPILNRGVNSIQLFRRNERWWISAMLWRREGQAVRIPDARPHDR